MAGGEPGARDLVRAGGPLLLHAVAPVPVAVAAVLVAGGAPAEHRLAAVAALACAAAVAWGPLLGTGPHPSRVLAGALGLVLAVAVPSAFLDVGRASPVAAGLVCGSFLLLTAGFSSMVHRLTRRALLGVFGGFALGALSLASLHLGDPFLLWNGGTSSETALTVLHAMNPVSAAAGDALGVDWIRFGLMYASRPGLDRFSMAGDYQLAEYARWWVFVLIQGGAGAVLLLAARTGGFPVSESSAQT